MKPDTAHLTYNNLQIGLISSISQMRKQCFREDRQLGTQQLRSEYRFFLQNSYTFYSFSLLLLKTAHRVNWFFFQNLYWKLCPGVCIIEQVEVALESWRDLWDFWEGVCALCYKIRVILFTCKCYQPSKQGPKYVLYCQCMPYISPLSFKSCP